MDTDARTYTVSEAARLAHVTVRTLHHYDAIGLLVPSTRSPSGYRLYTDADLRRLHQILLLRELGFPLETIRRVLDDPSYDRATALREQREALVERIQRTESVVRAIDRALDALERGTEMEPERLFEGFEDFDHAQYEDEARERWGHTEAYKESMRRVRRYTKEDWATIRAEWQGLVDEFAAMLRAGKSPEEAADVAERHRLHIERWFYPLTRQAHVGLAELYETDARFGKNFESRAPGLTRFVASAIRANAARAGA